MPGGEHRLPRDPRAARGRLPLDLHLAIGLTLALLAGLGCQRIATAPRPPAGAPSFLLVTIDTLRADHVGPRGDRPSLTPHLDRLAERGAVFQDAISVAPLTLPAHVSILTGLLPPHHGVRHNGIFRLAPETPTVATRLRAAGWRTSAVVGAAVLGAEFGLARGFDHYDDTMGDGRASDNGFPERRAGRVTDAALAWLRDQRTPYFLWVHYYDAHADYAPPEPWASRYAGDPYAGEIAYVDHELGRLLAGLASRSDRAGTYVLVTSDHGEGLGEHGEPDHSYLVYDADLRVPWIVTGPGVVAARHRGVVSHASVAPTIEALAGLAPDGKRDVPSLAALLRGRDTAAPGWAYAESLAGRLDHGWSALYAIRDDRSHYIRAPQPELYDVARDPGQLHNLWPSEEPGRIALVEGAEARLAAILTREQGLSPIPLGAARRAQIEALGYVVPETLPPERAVNPRDALPFAERGFLAAADLQAGRYEGALARLGPLLARFPESPRGHDLAARALLALGRAEEALPHAEKVVAQLPGRATSWALLAAVQRSRGEREAAHGAYEQALARDPEELDGHLGLLELALDDGSQGARKRSAALERLAAGRPEVLERVALLWERAGRPDEALGVLERAAAIHPDAARLQQRLAIAWARRGETDRALARRARASGSELDDELDVRLAVAFAATGNAREAVRLLRRLVARDPSNRGAVRLLARVERELGAPSR